jgi:hypothetical protein
LDRCGIFWILGGEVLSTGSRAIFESLRVRRLGLDRAARYGQESENKQALRAEKVDVWPRDKPNRCKYRRESARGSRPVKLPAVEAQSKLQSSAEQCSSKASGEARFKAADGGNPHAELKLDALTTDVVTACCSIRSQHCPATPHPTYLDQIRPAKHLQSLASGNLAYAGSQPTFEWPIRAQMALPRNPWTAENGGRPPSGRCPSPWSVLATGLT